MEKYVIISLISKNEMLEDLYDIEFEDIQQISKDAVADAKNKGVCLLFKESCNDRVISESFALVEYNFDMTVEDKKSLIRFLTQFFNDGKIRYRTMNISNTLKFVRFLKTDGELINI